LVIIKKENPEKMKKIKNIIWFLPFAGIIIITFAFFTPTAFFENRAWNHTLSNWIWGFYYDQLNQTITIGFYSNPLQFLPSVISSVIIILCLGIIGFSSFKHIKDFKNGRIEVNYTVIPSFLIIIVVVIWMIMMEIAELVIYDLSMWNRYIPNFGVIGMFLGTLTILSGFVLIRKYGFRDTNINSEKV
jgi:hypothetical protein